MAVFGRFTQYTMSATVPRTAALEPDQGLRVLGQALGQNFDGNLAVEARIPGAVDFSHPSSAERSENLIGTETRSVGQRHEG
jgi:hypothetical protein